MSDRHAPGSSASPHRSLTIPILIVGGVISMVSFGWPLLIAPGAGLEHAGDAPIVFAMILPLIIAVLLAEVSGGLMDAKSVAMLGVLSALGAGLRPLGAGTGGIEPVFFLLILAARVFGPGFGFVLGSTTLLGSALLTGGAGPWLPFQMLAASWVALGAGLLPHVRGRREVVMLALYGAAASLAFGLAMNLSFWPFTLGAGTQISYLAGAPIVENLRRFLTFNLATSLGWDVGRAMTTTLLLAFFGRPVLAILRRAERRAAFRQSGRFEVDALGGSAGVVRSTERL